MDRSTAAAPKAEMSLFCVDQDYQGRSTLSGSQWTRDTLSSRSTFRTAAMTTSRSFKGPASIWFKAPEETMTTEMTTSMTAATTLALWKISQVHETHWIRLQYGRQHESYLNCQLLKPTDWPTSMSCLFYFLLYNEKMNDCEGNWDFSLFKIILLGHKLFKF